MDDIVVIFDPTIELDVISIKDTEFGTDPDYEPTGDEVKYSKMTGDYSPFIQINGMKFTGEQITFMELDVTGFLPRITISIREKGGLFTSKAFPRDGDLINVYIKSNNAEFKPIRNDYIVLDVDAPVSEDEKGEKNVFTLSGILNIPGFWTDRIVSFSNMPSIDVLQQIAKEMNLGFATNEPGGLTDNMTWICPYTTYEDFIRNDVMASAYKDDQSFFTCYVDQFYMMNFVNMNEMFVADRELDQQTVNLLGSTDANPDDSEVQKVLSDMFLSNSKFVWGSPNQITGYAPINESGLISLKDGYRSYIQYYDKTSKDTTQYFIETLTTEGVEDKIILKGRQNDDHTQFVKTVNIGWQFDDNVHTNFQHAKLQNKYNSREIEKLKLSLSLSSINPNLYRGQIIPIYIVNNRGNDIRANATIPDDEPDKLAVDAFLSGYYVVKGMTYQFGGGRFYESLICTRREYDFPK